MQRWEEMQKQEEFYLTQHAGVTLHMGREWPHAVHLVGLYTVLRATAIRHNVTGKSVTFKQIGL